MPDHTPTLRPLLDDPTLLGVAGLPSHLPGDPKRQAIYSIQGTVYQAWCSIDAWLRLKNSDEVIYLEGAEDFDIVKVNSAITVQVKKNAGSISLGNAKAHEALENFWTLSCKEPSRRIDFHYLTTSSIAMEQDASFDGLKGIEAWRAAQTNPELAAKVATYLKENLPTTSSLRTFLLAATPDDIQQRLFRRFYWLTDQPEIEAVKRSVNNRIVVLLSSLGRAVSLSSNVQKYLESHFWEIVLESSASSRCLTLGDLLHQIEAATTVYLRVPVDQLPDLIGNAPPGLALLKLLLGKPPRPPDPLLRRPALTQHLEELVMQRRVILLTGSVYKGKTTLAQLVALRLSPEAWWIKLTERKPSEVDNLFLALAGQIENEDCPSLVIIDDLDITPKAHRGYKDSLGLVLHRAYAAGRGVILTAQGASSNSAVVQDFDNVHLLEVPEMSVEETEGLCSEHGCPAELSKVWGTFLTMGTRGHPKLVQVRIGELAARGWPKPTPADLSTQSSALMPARQMARQLLSDTVPSSTAEFVYLVSECSIPLHREIAIRLAETVEGLTNAGDVLDKLTGKWLERIENNWFCTTALLQGVATEVWSPEKHKQAHIRLHDAIRTKKTLDPSEAAALLFHAYLGGEPGRLAHTAMKLQLIDDHSAKREVERQLLWLPLVALESGQTIADNPSISVILRQLQFRVASTLGSNCLPQICQRWACDIERMLLPDAKHAAQAVMWGSIGFSQSLEIPLNPRLEAIVGISGLPSSLRHLQDETTRNLLAKEYVAESGLPSDGKTAQMILLFANRSVRDKSSLEELLQWLDNVASEEIRQQFDAMLEWPPVQDLGAFVQGSWAAKHEETQDWEPWVALFERINEYAKRRASPRFGKEAAKARATILTEYLGRSEDALIVLDQADAAFGSSAVLLEQRANVLFHRQDDQTVLKIWSQLTSGPASKATLDPFAYRRAGVSAARLKRWGDAEQIFLAAVNSITPGSFDLTKFGLKVDAALTISLSGNQITAARILAEAVLTLPSEAADEGDTRWDAVQRMTVEVCRVIKKTYWKQDGAESRIRPGDASSPILKAPKVEPGQAARTEMTRAQVLLLATTLGVGPSSITNELETLAGSRYLLVRWFASQARLALSYAGNAGSGFIRALVDFETATADLSTKQESLKPLEPDTGPAPNLTVLPERWFGLLVAGIVCSGPNLIAHLERWLDESRKELGDDAALTNAIQLVLDGASRPAEFLETTVRDTANPGTVRCGAAAKLLLNMPVASKTLQLEAFLASAAVSDESVARQELFNLHAARRFAGAWRAHAENRFQFSSPHTSVPALLLAVDDVEAGSGTFRRLLQAAANALGQPLGSFMEHVR